MKNLHSTRSRSRSPLRATPVAGAVAALLCTSELAWAQQAAPAAQTITVTGIRRGIESAIATKKNADTIVEAISAEDIGKLPDISVAESISRLPGVATQRSSVTGKAQDISVRGLSPDFNGGLLNGREQASTSTSRAVQFDQFPAELLGSILIHKTPEASLLGQGLASTIDMKTVRPLDFSGRNVVVSVRGESNAKVENLPGFKSGKGDREALSYIDQFADRTLGLAVGLTRSKSTGATQPDFQTWGGWVADVDYNGKTVKTPGGFTARMNDTKEERTAAMATLQYKPNKDFETSLDVFWSKGKFTLDRFGLEGPLGGMSAGPNDLGGKLINATVNAAGVATSGTFENYKGVINNHFNDYSDELKSIGWNLRGKVADWTLIGDLSYSANERKLLRYETTLGIAGNTYNAADTISYTGFDGTNLDQVQYKTGLNYADPNIIKLTDVQGWAGASGVQDGYYANPTTKDKVQATRFTARKDVSWGPISRIDAGGNFSERTKDRATIEGALVLKGALDASGNVVNRLIAATAPGSYTGVGGTTGIPTLNWDPRGSLGSLYQLSSWSDHDIVAKSWGVKEKVTTGYIKGDIDTEIAGIALRGNVGVQLVGTNQSATGFKVDAGSCNGSTHTCTYSSVNAGHNYSDVLPSMNLIADLGGDRVARFGLGRALSRPNMEDMKATVDFSYDGTKGRYSGSGGNPNLEPFRADAVDLSFEQYFGRKGYVSLAGFYKKLNTYILKTPQKFNFAPYLTPGSTAANPNVDVLTTPTNGSGGNISGVEFAVNVPLNMLTPMLDGFGVMVNYSDTTSSVSMSTSGFSTSGIGSINIPLPGLSRRVTNLRAYYEKSGFQIAVARRERSSFLGSVGDFQDNTQLVYIKGDATLDLQVSYEFQTGMFKGLSLLAQGQNLQNTKYVEFDPSSGNPTTTKKFGTTYLFGANYKF